MEANEDPIKKTEYITVHHVASWTYIHNGLSRSVSSGVLRHLNQQHVTSCVWIQILLTSDSDEYEFDADCGTTGFKCQTAS